MGKRKEEWWIEIDLTDKELRLLLKAVGKTMADWRVAECDEVEKWVRSIAIKAAVAECGGGGK